MCSSYNFFFDSFMQALELVGYLMSDTHGGAFSLDSLAKLAFSKSWSCVVCLLLLLEPYLVRPRRYVCKRTSATMKKRSLVEPTSNKASAPLHKSENRAPRTSIVYIVTWVKDHSRQPMPTTKAKLREEETPGHRGRKTHVLIE